MSSYKEVTQVTEIKLQSDIFQWHWNTHPDQRGQLFHVNQKSRNAIEGNHMKAIGVMPGVSDLIFIRKGKVLFIELKTDTGQQRPIQKVFQQVVEANGHQYIIIRSLEAFKELV